MDFFFRANKKKLGRTIKKCLMSHRTWECDRRSYFMCQIRANNIRAKKKSKAASSKVRHYQGSLPSS